MREKIYQHWLEISLAIFAIGIIMDVGVGITGEYVFLVSESFLDYIFAAIVSIGLISFSVIALIAGIMQKKYYGYKLSEILNFSSLKKKINFKKYIVVALVQIALAALLLAVSFLISCVNSLFFLMMSALFSAGCISHFTFDMMVDDKTAFQVISEKYESLSLEKQARTLNINHHIDTISLALNEAVDSGNIMDKNAICDLYKILIKSVLGNKENNWEAIGYIKVKLQRNCEKMSIVFGYEEMLKDVTYIFPDTDEWDYLMVDLYLEPLKNIAYYNDKQIVERNYTNQVLEICLMDIYKNGKITEDVWQSILFTFFVSIVNNNVCSQSVKSQILERYISELVNFHDDHSGKPLTNEQEATLRILKYCILKTDNHENQKYIFERLFRNIVVHNRYCSSEQYFVFLSIFYEAFYKYAFEEIEIVTKEYRKRIKDLFQTEISDISVSGLKASSFLEYNIKGVLSAFKYRIPEDIKQAKSFEAYADFLVAKSVVWAEDRNIRFFIMLYCVYNDQVGFYDPLDFLAWDSIEAREQKNILEEILKIFDMETGKFSDEFIKECKVMGEFYEHSIRMGDVAQEKLFNHIVQTQQKIIDVEINTEMEVVELNRQKVEEELNELMIRNKIYGWHPLLEEETYIKYGLSQLSRNSNNPEREMADLIKTGILSAVNSFIKQKAECHRLSYDEDGIRDMLSLIRQGAFDTKNFSYIEDWALLKYKDTDIYEQLQTAENKINMVLMPTLNEHIFTIDEKFKFSIKLSQIVHRSLTNDECVEAVEKMKKYREFYYVDGVLLDKARAVKCVKSKYHIDECVFKLYLKFSPKDVIYFQHV